MLICLLIAIKNWVKMGFRNFTLHDYEEISEFSASIYFNKKTEKFRIADGFAHYIDEEYRPNAIMIGLRCKRCGKKNMAYRRGKNILIKYRR